MVNVAQHHQWRTRPTTHHHHHHHHGATGRDWARLGARECGRLTTQGIRGQPLGTANSYTVLGESRVTGADGKWLDGLACLQQAAPWQLAPACASPALACMGLSGWRGCAR